MYLITWETYLLRREIKSLWYKWSKDDNWWIWTNKNIKEILNNNSKVYMEEIENKELPEMTKLDYEIAYAKKRLEKWENKQEKKELESQTTSLSQVERDFLRLWEPVKIWHHSQRRHEKLLEKVNKDWERRWQAHKEAEEAEDKKEYWEEKLKELEAKKNWTWKNAKQTKQEKIEYIKSNIKVWDKVMYMRQICKVLKINKNTIFTDWFTCNLDLSFINLID